MESTAILKNLNDFEMRCLSNDFENFLNDFKEKFQNCNDLLCEALNHIHKCFVESDFESVLQMDLKYYGFHLSVIDNKNQESFWNAFLSENSNDVDRQIKEFIIFFIAISSIQEFVRCNFCGPLNEVDNYSILSKLLPNDTISNSSVSLLLGLDGEPIYPNVVHPKLLYLSCYFLSNVKLPNSLTQKWWLLRSTFLHQLILSEKSNTLHERLVSLINDIYQMDWISKEVNILKKLMFATECCHIFLYYGELFQARKYITDAQIITGLEIELSGAMGKRTRHQEKPVAQLFVKVKRTHLNFTGTMPGKNDSLPADLDLQDDTLLNKVMFIDNDDKVLERLSAEEQLVLLGYCCLDQRSESFDELLQEKLMSYINCLLSQPKVWPVYLKALIMRCKIDKKNSRRIERAVMQMEAVVDCMRKPMQDSEPLKERLSFFYSTSFPAFWMLQKDLADLLLAIGCIKSALDLYEKLELWEEIVQCYVRLGRTNCAEKLICEQLEKCESPMLWCLLGDVTENIENYLKAWELSNHRSARAQRSLGYYYFKRREFEKSIPHFVLSLELNHLQPQVWFSTGHAATQVENFELAARAYRQVVMFDEDNFEAWNNLANAYIKTKQKDRAWRSLQESLKCNYEEWRVWENFLLVSTDLGAFEDAIRACHRLLDIKGKHCDLLLLDILVKAIHKDVPDINGESSSRLRKKMQELLGRITSVITNEPKVWELYSLLTNSSSDETSEKDILEKCILFQQKAVRGYNQKGPWEKDFSLSKDVLMCTLRLAELFLAYIKLLDGSMRNQQKMSARLTLQSVITRAKKFLDFFPAIESKELNDILDNLQKHLTEILNL